MCIDKAIYIYFPKNVCVYNRVTAFTKQNYASVGNFGLFCKPVETMTV